VKIVIINALHVKIKTFAINAKKIGFNLLYVLVTKVILKNKINVFNAKFIVKNV